MKIGIMLQSFCHFGGIGIYTREIVKRLIALDKSNEYIIIYPNFGQSSRFLGQFKPFNNVIEILSKSLVPHAIYWDHLVVPKIAKEYKVDLVFNPFLSVPLRGDFKKVFVMHGHEWFTMPEVFWLFERLIGRMRMKMVMQEADKIISISNIMTGLCSRATGLPESKFRTIYHGVDEKFKPICDERVLNEVKMKYHLPDKFILFVGGLYPQKNFHALIEAFAGIASDVPHQIVVAGKARWKYKGDLKLIADRGLGKKVQLLGWVDPEELPALYNLADVFVYPSFYEGFGLCLVEAMASGCPVVAASTGALPEVAGDAAILVDPLHHVELKEAIVRVIANPQLRQQLVRAGLKRAKNFTWERCAEETLKVFHEITSEAQRSFEG
jgi:glycosyltransferase involved in cell wall biosynthesis